MVRAFRSLPPALLILSLIAVPHLLYILSQWHVVPLHDGVPKGPTDPDIWLRLTLVREWLSGGSWYDHLVPRTNAPWGGISSPWTRPLDVVIAALVYVQPSSVALDVRLVHAALILPWLWMMGLLLGLFRILRIYAPFPQSYLMASLLVAAMPVTWNYFGLGNADHHAPLAVLLVWALGGILKPAPKHTDLILSGTLLALQLWVSTEALILIGLVYGWFGLQWLSGKADAMDRLVALASTVALGSALAVMIERPPSLWATPVYDSISIVYAVLLTLCALLALALRYLSVAKFALKLVAAGAGSAVVLLVFRAAYPLAMQGPLAGVDPYILSNFLPRISEAKPLFKQSLLYALGVSIQPLLALSICAAAWLGRSRSYFTKAEALPLLYFLLALFTLYVAQQRWGYYLYSFFPVVIAPVLAVMLHPDGALTKDRWPAASMRGLAPQKQTILRLPVLLFIIGMPLVSMQLNHSLREGKNPILERREACYREARALIRSGELDRAVGREPAIILAPTDLGTELLFFTRHRIVASNYHREGPGIRYVWETMHFASTPELRTRLRERGISHVLLCPSVERSRESLLQAVADGATPPSWLLPVPLLPTKRPTSGEFLAAPQLLSVAP